MDKEEVMGIRREFPILERTVAGRPMVYLDNTATSQTPARVVEEIKRIYTHEKANVHRGVHTLSQEMTDLQEQTREKVRRYINADSVEEVIFTRGTTEGINLNLKQEFTSDAAEEDAEYAVDFILTALNKPQVAENIFYDFDKATLRPESKEALDEIAQILRDNPYVSMEMASHTDRKGSEEYNMKLSERRARSVVDYLIKAGIEEERLSPKGYGKSRPKTVTKKIAREYPQFPEGTVLTEEYILTLSPADREAADQINRRTEFQVLSIDYRMY